MKEEKLLELEQERALADLRHGFDRAKDHGRDLLDVRALVRAQPLIAVGVASVAGFAATVAVHSPEARRAAFHGAKKSLGAIGKIRGLLAVTGLA